MFVTANLSFKCSDMILTECGTGVEGKVIGVINGELLSVSLTSGTFRYHGLFSCVTRHVLLKFRYSNDGPVLRQI